MKQKMDLADWKTIELTSKRQYEEAVVTLRIAEILYQEAIVHIKELGGKTIIEEEAEIKKNAEEADKSSTNAAYID